MLDPDFPICTALIGFAVIAEGLNQPRIRPAHCVHGFVKFVDAALFGHLIPHDCAYCCRAAASGADNFGLSVDLAGDAELSAQRAARSRVAPTDFSGAFDCADSQEVAYLTRGSVNLWGHLYGSPQHFIVIFDFIIDSIGGLLNIAHAARPSFKAGVASAVISGVD
jgi:hypothetical protein